MSGDVWNEWSLRRYDGIASEELQVIMIGDPVILGMQIDWHRWVGVDYNLIYADKGKFNIIFVMF